MTRRGKKRLALLTGVIVVGVVGVGGLWLLRNTMRISGARSGLEEGRAYYQQGEYARSFEGLNRYIRIFPDDVEARYMLADARRRVPMENNRHLATSASFARLALETDPGHVPTFELLLDVYPQIGQYIEASNVARTLLEIDPGHSKALWTLVQSDAVVGNLEPALEHAARMIELDPTDMRPRRAMLELMGLLGSEVEEIIARSSQFIDDEPENLQLQLLHIDLLFRYGRDEEAEPILASAVELEIHDPDTLALLVSLLDQRGMRDQSELIIERALAQNSTSETSRGIQLERLWKQGRATDARQLLQDQPLDLSTGDDALLGWAAIVSHTSEDSSSNAIIEQLMARSTDSARFWRDAHRAYVLMQDAQWVEAYRILETLSPIVQEADRELLEYWNGVCLHALGEASRATDAFRIVTRLDPTWDQPAINLTRALLDTNQLPEAFSLVRNRLRFADHPERDLVSALVVTNMAEDGVLEEGDALQFADVLEQNLRPDDIGGTVRALLARLYLTLDQPDRAQSMIQDIIENNRQLEPSAMVALHGAMQRSGLSTSELARASASSDPSNPDAIFLLAMESSNAGRQDEAKSMFRDALASTNSIGMQRAYAAFLDRTQDPDAAQAFRELSDTHEGSPQAQQSVLESSVAWLDEQLVADAINRLHEITGDEGTVWKLFDARRLLVFHRDPEHASDASLILRDILQDNQQYTAALVLMADAMFVLGNPGEGIAYLERVVLSQPEHAGHYAPLIRQLQQAGRLEDAERWLRDYLQIDSLTIDQRRERASMLLVQGLWGAALPELQELATTGDPNDLIRLARAHIRQGEPEQAETVFQRILQSPDASVAHWSAAAEFYASQGNLQRGLDTIANAPAESEIERTLLRASLYEKLTMLDDARSTYRQAALSDPSGDSWRDVIAFLIRNRDIEGARSALREALDAHPENTNISSFETLLADANQSLSSEQITQLAESLGADIDPEAVNALLEAVRQFRDSNASDESIASIQRVVETYPWFYTAWNTWISALVASDAPDALARAAEASRQALSALPNDVRVASLAYEVFMRAGLHSDAANAAQEWKLRAPSAALVADVAFAGALQQQGAFADALKALEPWEPTIISEVDSQPDRFAMYVAILLEAGDIDQAESLLFPLARNDERWARTMLRLAPSLPLDHDIRQRWFQELRTLLTDALDITQLVAFAHESATSLGSWWYQQVLELAPAVESQANLRFHALRFSAAAHDGLGNSEQAIDLYRQVLQLQPNEPFSHNNLAYLLFRTGENLDEALVHARRAVELMPQDNSENVRDTLGEILLAQQNHQEATSVYQQGLDLFPGSLRMRLGLAEAAIIAGDNETARTHLRSIRDSGGFDSDSGFQTRFTRASQAVGTLD
ncbi:MAG: tetratricopeptide repeat protein [Phycisphaerales bacterium JB043]